MLHVVGYLYATVYVATCHIWAGICGRTAYYICGVVVGPNRLCGCIDCFFGTSQDTALHITCVVWLIVRTTYAAAF